jgi:hypothetical protein
MLLELGPSVGGVGCGGAFSALCGAAATWRSLAFRRTDEHVRTTTGVIPLSVATDRIGVTAMRAASLQALLMRQGHDIQRSGTGLLVEGLPRRRPEALGTAAPGLQETPQPPEPRGLDRHADPPHRGWTSESTSRCVGAATMPSTRSSPPGPARLHGRRPAAPPGGTTDGSEGSSPCHGRSGSRGAARSRAQA